MALSLEKIEALAPDQGSLDAARKLLKPAQWPTLAQDGADLVWGECQGSGATPYRVCVTETDAGYKCSCPSRKFPCKHSLALMWMRTEGKVTFTTGTPPEWVKDWLSRRRGPSEVVVASARPKVSIAASGDVTDDAPDPKAEARAAAARERNRLDREASIAAGLDELDIWLRDQIDSGLAGFAANAVSACRTIAQRLVDAKASGLAARLDALPARLFACPDAARPRMAVVELGQIHLIAEAYRRQDVLTPALRADVRQTIGWTMTRESLLADPDVERITGAWQVWATRSEVQPDRLRRLETWLYGQGRFAVLIDFVPVATGAAASGYTPGGMFDAELAFYPSPVPARALLVRQTTSTQPISRIEIPDQRLEAAYSAYESAMAARPWLGDYPLAFRGARIRRTNERTWLHDGGLSLPLPPEQETDAWPLLREDRLDGLGLWNGNLFELCWADTAQGRWTA